MTPEKFLARIRARQKLREFIEKMPPRPKPMTTAEWVIDRALRNANKAVAKAKFLHSGPTAIAIWEQMEADHKRQGGHWPFA